ncbi:glycosyltransferase [Bacillus sp. RAR_GA_16]|uniref:glycosyltransferase n=1 Tax=Bacillus sp. RAR_GA_16 TaxID=2876774 RepID=UPI001CCEC4C4|nr:glycosyltransferase family 2 protein [Bacillus sp. RAR_GA_16]MCA0174111.1 glycosyltransferase family 2 protein [Bacillus sp. RAR_GA_16]
MFVIYLCILSLFLFWTIINSLFMPRLKKTGDENGLVSILVPLRDEERNVKDLVTSLQRLTYHHFEVLFLDDHSSDQTLHLLRKHTRNDSRFTVLEGNELPEGWTGKVYACHQLSEHARGEYLLFNDADLRLSPDAIQASLSLMKKKSAAMLTGFPAFPVSLFLEKLLVPLQHFVVHFHLPLAPANYTTLPAFTAAHGAFMMVHKEAYQQVGGHASIRDTLLDDIDLAKAFKRKGKHVLLANITKMVTCYMYQTNREVWNGFTKNLFPGLGRSRFLIGLLFLFYGCFYVGPLVFILIGLYTSIAGSFQFNLFIPYLLIVLQKAWIDLRTEQRMTLSLLMPFSAIAFMVLLIHSMQTGLKQKGYVWKGRTYS